MNQISVTGGKGGTGKSTFAVLLASHLARKGEKTLLVDLDVECPNDYLLTGRKLGSPRDLIYGEIPVLDKTRCTKCRKCIEVCESNAIFMPKGRYPLFLLDLCSQCGACNIVCPENAIKVKKKRTGEIFVNEISKHLILVTGLAKAGLEETGPVVAKAKKFAVDFAKKNSVKNIIIDTAAGTHCPVIQALLESEKAFVVTEPTPMGAHDLGLILDLCKKLKVDFEVVLNRSDLGKEKLIKEKIDIKIPYSKKIEKAYLESKLYQVDINSIIKSGKINF